MGTSSAHWSKLLNLEKAESLRNLYDYPYLHMVVFLLEGLHELPQAVSGNQGAQAFLQSPYSSDDVW
jgi:hypothetical protein